MELLEGLVATLPGHQALHGFAQNIAPDIRDVFSLRGVHIHTMFSHVDTDGLGDLLVTDDLDDAGDDLTSLLKPVGLGSLGVVPLEVLVDRRRRIPSQVDYLLGRVLVVGEVFV